MDKQNKRDDDLIHHQEIWKLLGKKAAGEASNKELNELNDLLKAEGENVQYMMNVMDHYWKSIQEASENGPVRKTIELHKRKAIEMVNAEHDHLYSGRPRLIIKKKKWIWAAAVILCLFGGWFVYHITIKQTPEMNVVATKNGSKTKVTLPDGTKVWLNVGSKLIYPNDFQHIAKREVSLIGEAYFEVKHDNDHPFVIHTTYLNIKDLGTSFNVKDYPSDKEAEATLISGSIKVILRSDPGKALVLKPHEKVSYFAGGEKPGLQKSRVLSEQKKSTNLQPIQHQESHLEMTKVQPVIQPSGDTILSEIAWTNNQLVFQSEDFIDLAKRMDRWYNVNIRIKDRQIANYTFTGIFDGETLVEALNELQMIRPFQYRIKKNEVVITASDETVKPPE